MSKLTTVGPLLHRRPSCCSSGRRNPSLPRARTMPVKKGAQVYAAQKCQTCHSIAGKGRQDEPARRRRKEAQRRRHHGPWIVDPVAMAKKAGSTKKPPMPNKYGKLPAADIDALVAYMGTLK